MLERILVCLDGSKLAEQILPYVSAEASRFNSEVILFQAIPEPSPPSAGIPLAGPLPAGTPEIVKESVQAEAEARVYLAKVAERFVKKGIVVDTVTMPGRAGEAIVQYAVENVELIALATHGRGGLGRAIFGSVADFVLRESGLPMLVIKPQEVKAPASLKPKIFEKILVCLDGSRLAEQILPYVQAQAAQFDSKIILLQVATIPTMALAGAGSNTAGAAVSGEIIAEQYKLAEDEARKYLQKIAESLDREKSNIEVVVLQGIPVGSTIVDYAGKGGIDLICLATHGHSGLGRMVFGSVADHVLKESGLPILVIKPQDRRE